VVLGTVALRSSSGTLSAQLNGLVLRALHAHGMRRELLPLVFGPRGDRLASDEPAYTSTGSANSGQSSRARSTAQCAGASLPWKVVHHHRRKVRRLIFVRAVGHGHGECQTGVPVVYIIAIGASRL